MMAEETPRKPIVLVHHEDTDSASTSVVADVAARGHVPFPDDGEEEGPCAVHDGDVGEMPVLIVGTEGFDNGEEEGVLRGGAHCVVGDAGGSGAADPS